MSIDEMIKALDAGDERLDVMMQVSLWDFQARAITDKLREQEARLQIAEDLVDHILTSESMNPELRLALAFRAAGKGSE